MNSLKERFELIGAFDRQSFFGLVRLILILACLAGVSVLGTSLFDEIIPGPSLLAEQYRQRYPLLSHVSLPILSTVVRFTHPQTLRYMIAPVLAITFVLISAARFIQDIYALDSFKHAWRYLIASLFATGYPQLVIEKGKVQVPPNEVNLIDKIGGPGFVLIQPGNAAMFRRLRGPSGVRVTSTYFLEPFERIEQCIYLDDQQGDRDEVPNLMTRDGIRVTLKDVHFRYRIKQQTRNGAQVRKTLQDPYPYDSDAMWKVAFNVTAVVVPDDKGKPEAKKEDKPPETLKPKFKVEAEDWTVAVERAVIGGITDFIASKKLDELTAPIGLPKNPRLELRDDILFRTIQRALNGLGAELIWIDVGHIHIVEESVDDQRTSVWAADWLGDAEVTRAYGEAKRLAYQELGRAEAQAELILGIMDAFKETAVETSSTPSLRNLILVRTAQLIDAMSSTQAKDTKSKEDNKGRA